MSVFRGDASEVYQLAADLSAVGAKSVPVLRAAMAQAGREFAADWSANAVETSGTHGKHYPKSIDSELAFDLGGISVEVGPNRDKKQGSMGRGFEFGSENQPPHLDGIRAMPAAEDRAEGLIAAAMAGAFVETPAANAAELLSYTTRAGVTRLATQAQVDNWTRGS